MTIVSFSGQFLRATNAGLGNTAFEEASAGPIFNQRRPSRRPAAVLRPADVADVAAGVRLAAPRGCGSPSARAGTAGPPGRCGRTRCSLTSGRSPPWTTTRRPRPGKFEELCVVGDLFQWKRAGFVRRNEIGPPHDLRRLHRPERVTGDGLCDLSRQGAGGLLDG